MRLASMQNVEDKSVVETQLTSPTVAGIILNLSTHAARTGSFER